MGKNVVRVVTVIFIIDESVKCQREKKKMVEKICIMIFPEPKVTSSNSFSSFV